MSKIKNGGSDQCGAVPFEQQQFGTAGIEWFKERGHVGVYPQVGSVLNYGGSDRKLFTNIE